MILHNCTEGHSTRLRLIRDVWHYLMSAQCPLPDTGPRPIRGQDWPRLTNHSLASGVSSQSPRSYFLWLMTWYRYLDGTRFLTTAICSSFSRTTGDLAAVWLKLGEYSLKSINVRWLRWIPNCKLNRVKTCDDAIKIHWPTHPPVSQYLGQQPRPSPPENQSYFDSNDPIQHQPVNRRAHTSRTLF